MSRPIRPYLQLIRLPNLFTAAADSLAGWLLAMVTFAEPGRWLPLLGASMAIYAAGIALNDLLDYRIDLVERPGRPLPSGRVSRRFASVLGFGLLVVGLGLAALSGSAVSLGVAAALVACVLGYDLGLKRTFIGPLVMGSCRGLNLLLGMSQGPGLGGPTGWLAAGSLALFVAGVTWISRSETESGRSSGVAAGASVQGLGLIGLVVAAIRAAGGPSRPILPAEGLVVLSLVALIVGLADVRALRSPEPRTIQAAVKTGVLALVWLDVGLVASVRGPGPALAVAVLWLPAFLLGRWLYTT